MAYIRCGTVPAKTKIPDITIRIDAQYYYDVSTPYSRFFSNLPLNPFVELYSKLVVTNVSNSAHSAHFFLAKTNGNVIELTNGIYELKSCDKIEYASHASEGIGTYNCAATLRFTN